MKNATLLVLVAAWTDARDLKPLLEAADAVQAHLSVLVLGTLPPAPIFAYGSEPYMLPAVPEDWQDRMETAQTDLSETARAIDALLRASDTSGDVAVLGCEPAALPAAIARRAATCDAILLDDALRDDEDLFHQSLHGALFHAPAATLLNATGGDATLSPAHVFVAWDAGLPAARAAHAALPLLTGSNEVTIGLFDPVAAPGRDGDNPGSDVARWLSHHGCHVTVQQYPSGGEEIGTCILRRAAEIGAELVVMGAYGHSRLRQAVFGGTTRRLIAQRDLPVLMAH